MTIGIDANEANLTTSRVGINEYAFNLLHALCNLKSSHQFVIYLKSNPLPDLPSPRSNWQYRVIPFPKFWTQTRLPLDLYTHRPQPDVFFSMTHYAPRWSPIPTVVSIMDLGFLQTPDQFTSKDFNQLRNWTAYSVKQATKIIAISEHTKKDVVKVYGRNPNDITVTHLAYNKDLFKPTVDTKALQKYNISKPYFLFLSSLKPSKNIEGLVKAFSQLQNHHMLVIAGKKAWLYDQIFALVKKLKLENKIIFTGFVEERDKPALMSQASAFILPSFHEGFGIPVLEAMACGIPVVISKTASLPEVGGDAAIYVDPHDTNSIVNGMIKATGPERSRRVRAGLSRIKLFNWNKTARQTLICLETAWADNSRHRK